MASDVRKPPLDEIFALHLPQERGKCRWCGKPTDDRDSRGKLRWWHPECEVIVQMLARAEVLRRHVFNRDLGICAKCGEDYSERARFVPTYVVSKREMELWTDEARSNPSEHVSPGPRPDQFVRLSWENEGEWWGGKRDRVRYPYVALTAISMWQVEHRTPLWKVAHMPAVQRIAYFMLDAVETWCEVCHKFKTAKESADRAKINARLKEPEAKPKRAWTSRPLESGNGFPPKGSQKISPRPFQKRRKPG